MDFKKLTNSEMQLDINDEKITNHSVLQKPLNNSNMNISNNNLNSSTLSMKEKLKIAKNTQAEINFNDTEKNLISPDDIILETQMKEKQEKIEENFEDNNPFRLNVQNYQAEENKEIPRTTSEQINFEENKSIQNNQNFPTQKINHTNTSLYSLHSGDINVTNSINEFQNPENYLNHSNLNCSLNKENLSKLNNNNINNKNPINPINQNNNQNYKNLNNNNNNFNNNSALNNNKNNLSQISGIRENNKTNLIEMNNNNNNNNNLNNSNLIKSNILRERESYNPHVKNEIIFPGEIPQTRNQQSNQNSQILALNNNNNKNIEDDISIREKISQISRISKTENEKNLRENNLKSHMQSELDIDENDIVLLSENNNNNLLNQKEEKEFLIPNNNNPHETQSIYEDAKSHRTLTVDNNNNNIQNEINNNNPVNVPAYGNIVRERNEDESSIITDTEISIYSNTNNKYMTFKNNNRINSNNDLSINNNNNYLNASNTNNNLNINTNLNVNQHIKQQSGLFSPQEKSMDQSSFMITKNPTFGAYYEKGQISNNENSINNNNINTSNNNNIIINTNENLNTSNYNNNNSKIIQQQQNIQQIQNQVLETKSQISENNNLNNNNNYNSYINTNMNKEENLEFNPIESEQEKFHIQNNKIKYNIEEATNIHENRSNFFSPTAQTPLNLNLKEHNQNNDLRDFNLNEIENQMESNKTNNQNTNNYLISDIEEFGKNNFRTVLETDTSKMQNNTQTNYNYNYDIQGDNSKFDFTIDSRRKDSEITNSNLNINPYRRNTNNTVNNNNVNKSSIEDRKIQTIFDKINTTELVVDSANDKEKKEVNKMQLNNTANNININEFNKLNYNNNNNNNNNNAKGAIIINQANITNSYNININNDQNANKDFQINQDQLLDIDTTAILKAKNINTTNNNISISKIEEKEIKIEKENNNNLENEEDEIVCAVPDELIITEDKNKEKLLIPITEAEEKINSEKDLKSDAISEITYRAKDPEKQIIVVEKENNNENINIEVKEKENLENMISLSASNNSKKLEAIKKIEEPENDQNIFEESLIYEDLKDFKILDLSNNNNNNNKNNKEILSRIYTKNFVEDWKKKTCTKIASHVKDKIPIEEVKYYENNVLNQKDFVNELPDLVTNYEKELNFFVPEINKEIENYQNEKEKENGIDLKIFKVENKKNLLENLNNNENNNNIIELKEREMERNNLMNLLHMQNCHKNSFNKISAIYNTDILNKKYKLNNKSIKTEKNSKIKNPFKYFKNEENKYQENENDNFKNSEISYWRESLCDGNSFYRMFIFSLMEQFILKKNFMEMAKLFKKVEKDYLEINKFNDNFKPENKLVIERIFRNIDIDKVRMIFNEILMCMMRQEFQKAYNVLINAFNLQDESFDKIMIEYLRINLYKQLINAEIIFDDKMQHGRIAHSYEILNLRSNAYLFIAPSKIHFDILVKIFKINICLYHFDGSINGKNQNNFSAGKNYFYHSKDFSTPTFKLFYNLNHYSKFYEENEFENNREILNNPLMDIKESIAFEDKGNNRYVCFLKQGVKVCYKSLKEKVDKILLERAKNLDMESYISREFYCKPVEINFNNNKDVLIVDDYSYINIYEKNFWNTMIFQIRQYCIEKEKQSAEDLVIVKENPKQKNKGGCCHNGCLVF